MHDERIRFRALDWLFRIAVRLTSEDRETMLREVGEHDPDLQSSVEAMLIGDAATGLEVPAWDQMRATSPATPSFDNDAIPDIPNYTIEAQIGAGTMGVVYRARQHEPVERQVALKLVRLGMNSADIVRRFEYERQTLARFNHPGVARVLDAGLASDGRPFFVMEYVDGVPLDRFCDAHRLSVTDRLALFARLCHAVHHAHQKGIIHRDLKPSNVLVTDYDGEPVPVVIDFGIAKAVHADGLAQTLATAHGQIMGTPAYMSPEQSSSSDVDVRTDVYALGIILYQLLVGSTPLQFEQHDPMPYEEMFRQIRESYPDRPSTRLTTAAPEFLQQVCDARRCSIAEVQRDVRGDLDWIVMRAIARDPEERYGSALALGEDIERYLRVEPVSAGPPSRTYLARKFVRRHRGPVAASLALLLVIVAGGATSAVFAIRENRARLAAERQTEITDRINHFLNRILASPNPSMQGRDIKAIDLITDAERDVERLFGDEPLIEAGVRRTIGRTYLGLGEMARADIQLSDAMQLREAHLDAAHAEVLQSRLDMAFLRANQGRLAEAETEYDRCISGWQSRPDHLSTPLYWDAINGLANVYLQQGHFDEAERLLTRLIAHFRSDDPDAEALADALNNLAAIRYNQNLVSECAGLLQESLAIYELNRDDSFPAVLELRGNLGSLLLMEGRLDEAEILLSKVTADNRQYRGPEHPATLDSLNNLAQLHVARGDYKNAALVQQETLDICLESLGETHPTTMTAMGNLVQTYVQQRRTDGVVELASRVLALRREHLGDDHPQSISSMNDFGKVYLDREEYHEAERVLREAVERGRESVLAPWEIAVYEKDLGDALMYLERYDEAEMFMLKSFETLRAQLGEDHDFTQVGMYSLSALYERWGNLEKSREWRARVTIEVPDRSERAASAGS